MCLNGKKILVPKKKSDKNDILLHPKLYLQKFRLIDVLVFLTPNSELVYTKWSIDGKEI